MKKYLHFNRLTGALLIVLSVIVFSLPCGAREEATDEQQLEEITVTAQKREENSQDIPISMDVFSDTDIEDAGIGDLRELTYFSPNIYSMQNTNQNMVFIRGISSHSVILNTSVGLFVDDINYPMSFMQNPDLLDVERIEILRGPQGTLYGRNTESGAIKVVTRQPGNEFSAKVYSEMGVYDTSHGNPFFIKAGTAMSGPVIKDKLFIGGAFQVIDTDGYTENIRNGNDKAGKKNHYTGQASLRWTPTEQMDISLKLNGSEQDNGYGYARYADGPDKTDRYRINWEGNNEWKDENFGQALKINYKGHGFDVVSITTHNDFNTNFTNDDDFGPVTTVPGYPNQHFEFDNQAVSQELRLVSPEEQEKFQWLIGIFGFSDDNKAVAEFFGMSRETDFDTKGYALFGQATYSFLDRLRLTAGLRYDNQTSEGTQIYNYAPKAYSADCDHSELLPKATLAMDMTDTAMGYVTVARGMMAGGFDYAFATNSETLTFDPEFTWNYEVGIKTTWLNNRLKVNAALYYIDIKDKQVQEWLSGPGVRKITNAAKAHSQGAEMDLNFRLLPGLTIFGGLGISNARIDDWISDETGGGTYDYQDKYLTFAPTYTFNAGIKYSHSSGWYARTDILGVSDFYATPKNTQKIDGYETANLTLGYQGESFGISLWCKNLFDKAYLTNKSEYTGGNTLVIDGQPRTIGTTISYRF